MVLSPSLGYQHFLEVALHWAADIFNAELKTMKTVNMIHLTFTSPNQYDGFAASFRYCIVKIIGKTMVNEIASAHVRVV